MLEQLQRDILEALGTRAVPVIYREQILSGRTRQFVLFPESSRRVPPEDIAIIHTLLGIEIKVGRRRLGCPDLATARFLQVFARLGVGTVAVPYDISQISRIADDLESGWQHLLLIIEDRAGDRPGRTRIQLRNQLIAFMRAEIEKLGAGTKIPEFNQNTKQRRLR
ncbi:MAG: hypothetical protein K1Y36_12175 [Blastocatellia bacterium]|nr:hypothetical protein [Blastocatellia bacterium]